MRAVLVCHGIAETRQQALLVALHDCPIEPAHHLFASLLKGAQHLSLVLCVEILQKRVGLEKVRAADQDRHLPAFGLANAIS